MVTFQFPFEKILQENMKKLSWLASSHQQNVEEKLNNLHICLHVNISLAASSFHKYASLSKNFIVLSANESIELILKKLYDLGKISTQCHGKEHPILDTAKKLRNWRIAAFVLFDRMINSVKIYPNQLLIGRKIVLLLLRCKHLNLTRSMGKSW